MTQSRKYERNIKMKRTLSTLVVLIILTLSVFSKGQHTAAPANRLYDHVSQANVWMMVKEAKSEGGYNTFAFEYNPDNDGTVDIYGVTDLLIDENQCPVNKLERLTCCQGQN